MVGCCAGALHRAGVPPPGALPQHPETSTPLASKVLFSMTAVQLRRTAKRWLWLKWLQVTTGVAASCATGPTTLVSKTLPVATPVALLR